MTYYSIREAAKHWSVSECLIRTLIREGKLRAVKLGKCWRISSDAMARYEEENGNRTVAVKPKTVHRIVTRI